MRKTLTIYNVDIETRLRMRLLCVAKGVTMAQLLTIMVDKEWNGDNTIATDKLKRLTRRLTKQALR